MDKLNHYRHLIKNILREHASRLNQISQDEIASYPIFDIEHDQYMLYRTGWVDKRRVQTPYLYVRIDNTKFWIEEDYTEDGIATDLLSNGVAHNDIVLAFRHPTLRQFTEFAIA